MVTDKPIGGIILAAGQSRRFGADKRAHLLSTGRSLLEATIATALTSISPLVVTLGYNDQPLRHRLLSEYGKSGLQVIVAEESAEGMGRSIANSISFVQNWSAALILLGDMPYIKPSTLQQIIDRYIETSSGIVVPVNNHSEGHPVLFDARFFPNLVDLQGDKGARSVIRNHKDDVFYLVVDDPGILHDIDRIEDLAAGSH